MQKCCLCPAELSPWIIPHNIPHLTKKGAPPLILLVAPTRHGLSRPFHQTLGETLAICLSIYLSIYLSFYLFIYLSIYLYHANFG